MTLNDNLNKKEESKDYNIKSKDYYIESTSLMIFTKEYHLKKRILL